MHSPVLKACIFATGLAGIVAEYVMATLASYMLGDAVLQWSLTVSLMLFAMGVGSRLSRFIQGSVIDAFVAVEKYLLVKQGVLPSAAVRGPVGYVLDKETRLEVDRLFVLLSSAVEAGR